MSLGFICDPLYTLTRLIICRPILKLRLVPDLAERNCCLGDDMYTPLALRLFHARTKYIAALFQQSESNNFRYVSLKCGPTEDLSLTPHVNSQHFRHLRRTSFRKLSQKLLE